MADDENQNTGLQKGNSSNPLSKIIEIPFGAKMAIEIAIDRENAKARIKIEVFIINIL